jgi:hypothetical protein
MDWTRELAVLASRGVEFAPGLSQAELSVAEERVGCQFPPDLRSFLRTALPSGTGWPDWRVPASPEIADRLGWPAAGFEFDIRNNVFWWPAWGPQPGDLDQAVAVMRERVREAPQLIPICQHVYLPAEPAVAGNPAFSVYQADIIYGGRNLGEYLRRVRSGEEWELPRCDEVRRIRFWSEVVEWNAGCGEPVAAPDPAT